MVITLEYVKCVREKIRQELYISKSLQRDALSLASKARLSFKYAFCSEGMNCTPQNLYLNTTKIWGLLHFI